MSDRSRARLILERWNTSISREDRRHDKMSGLFNSLCEDMFFAGIEFDAAYDCVKEAAKLLYPSAGVVKSTYGKNPKIKMIYPNVEDFARSWHDNLNKAALESFYSYYQIDGMESAKDKVPAGSSAKDDDALNEEHFWKLNKLTTKDNPWLFKDEE